MGLIGSQVVYRGAHGAPEQGEVTSYNGSYVFVRFSGSTSAGCAPGSLEHLDGSPVKIPHNWSVALEEERKALAAHD